MRPAVRREIRSAARQVEVFYQQNLIRNLKANRADTLYLHAVNLGTERLEFGDRFQVPGGAQWSTNLERAFHSGVSRNLARQIKAKQRIRIQMMECEFEIGVEVLLQRDGSHDGQVGLIKFRVGVDIELTPVSDRVDIEISR